MKYQSLWFRIINARTCDVMMNPAAELTQELNDVLESMSDSFFSVDREWRLTRINAQYEKIGGVNRKDRIGKCFKEILVERGLQESKYWTE